MKIAITGASGFIGRRLLASLNTQGHDITVLSRGHGRSFPENIRVINGDLRSAQSSLSALVTDCQVLFHCAGEIHDVSLMKALHVEGTERLLRAALDRVTNTNTRLHWVQLSSVGAYGPPSGLVHEERVITEQTKSRPVGEYEVTKTQSDDLIKSVNSSNLFSYSIVRPSNVIAHDMPNASVRALGTMVRRGLFFYVGPRGAIATYVHVDDVVETLVRCAFDPRAKGNIFNISNDCALEEMIDRLAMTFGVRTPRIRLPESLVRAAARLAGSVVNFPLTEERINALMMRTRYPYAKLEKQLGFKPQLSIPEIIGDVVLGRDVQQRI